MFSPFLLYIYITPFHFKIYQPSKKQKQNYMAIDLCNSFRILTLCFLALGWLCNAKNPVNGDGGFKGMFIFGSSIVDNGNNNNIVATLAKANYLPYGMDFGTTTGRFSNGKNFADFIGDYLKLPLIPAFADPQTKGDAILHGVNFGSGGSGILDETGLVVVNLLILLNEVLAIILLLRM